MRLAVAVLRPDAPVVTQHIAGFKGRLVRRALGAQAAGRAGLVVDRLVRARRRGFQILFLRFFRREAVRRQIAVFGLAIVADGLRRAGRRAAVAVVRFRMTFVTFAGTGVGAVPVGGPCAPIVIQSGTRRGKRVGFADLTAGAGQVVNRVVGAVRRRFQRFGLLNLLCVGMYMARRPMRIERLRASRRHGGVFLDLRATVLFRVPAGEIISRIAGNRKRAVGFTGRHRLGFVRFVQRTAVGVKGHRKGPCDHAGDEVQLLVVLILDMGIYVVREETPLVIRAVSIGKRHGIAGVFGGNADRRAFGHAELDGQRLAGGQIHIVGLAGNRVVLHEGLVCDPQLAAVFGVDINAAAIAAGFVVLDLAAMELADRAGAVNIHAAAVAGGRIAGDFAALHDQPRRLLIQIDGAAGPAGVSGDLAVIEEELALLVKHMNRAAFLCSLVAADLAAPHVERRRLI